MNGTPSWHWVEGPAPSSRIVPPFEPARSRKIAPRAGQTRSQDWKDSLTANRMRIATTHSSPSNRVFGTGPRDTAWLEPGHRHVVNAKGWPQMSAPVREGDVLDAKYRVERILGQGGMGVVVAAQHLQLGQRVAVKF